MSEGREKAMAHIDKVLAAVDAFADVTRFSEHPYYWKKLREYAEALFERGPFKPGDKVRLTKTIDVTPEKSWGWMAYKHMLVEGNTATVKYVDYREGHFNAMVLFDRESVFLYDGKEVVKAPEDRGLFTLWDTQIERVEWPVPRQSTGEGDG